MNHGDAKYKDDELSKAQQLEVLRYRCFVLTPEVPDCWPYDYFFHEKYEKKDKAARNGDSQCLS